MIFDNKHNTSKNIKSKLLEDYKIKIICFLLAVLMYFTIAFVQRNTKTYSSPLKVVNLKDYLVISNSIPVTVKIIIKDKEATFDKITEEEFNVRLDLSNINEATNTKVKVKWDVPKNMKSFFSSVRIVPDVIDVEVEKLMEKNVNVVIMPIGNPAPGYILKRTTYDPPKIRIQGPKSVIEKINSIKTEIINIEGAKDSFSRMVNLVTEHPKVKALGKVNIFVEIVEETNIMTIKFQKINFVNLKKQFKAKIRNQVTLKLEGPTNDIQKLGDNDISVYVDCAGVVYPGEYPLLVKVEKPESLKVISVFPEMINVMVGDK